MRTTLRRIRRITLSGLVFGLALWLACAVGGANRLAAQTPEPALAPPAIKAITGGSNHTCVVTAAGGVKCWGSNQYGQLGDGTANNRAIAVDAVGLASGVQAVVAGNSQTCALTEAGRVLCWGYDSLNLNRQTPTPVEGLSSGVQAIAHAANHVCVVIGGGVKCWGWNYAGQLGDGTRENRAGPVPVLGIEGRVQAVAAGSTHSCALTEAGGVFCWGANFAGQLGEGSTTDRLQAVAVAGLAGGVQAIAAGAMHTCALLADGSVQCWGGNDRGQLGNDTNQNATTPVAVPGLAGVEQLVAGDLHTCALLANEKPGGVQCWGANNGGQLGDGTLNERRGLVDVAGLDSGVTAIGGGPTHTCALLAGGARCWGVNYYAQLGNGSRYREVLPVTVADLPAAVQAIVAGDGHTCLLTASSKGASGGVYCWGRNERGQLGDGGSVSHYQPAPVIGLGSMVRAIAAGWDHMCALDAAGGVLCWGDNWLGQLGDGTAQSYRNEPAAVIGLDSGVQAITAGRGHTCALTAAGGVQCWGDNKGGQLGNGTQTDSPQPVAVAGLDMGVRAVAAGLGLTCALTDGGGVKCWGAGRVGDGTPDLRSTPVDVVGLGSGVQAITAGDWHVCALLESGGVQCWGDNQQGQLGDGSTEARLSPVAVVGLESGVQQIDAGRYATCAVMAAGGVRCWGWLQATFDTFDDFSVQPVPVGGLNGDVQAVATGGGHVCALATSDATPGSSIQCWGFNVNGQLGVNPGWAPLEVTALLPRALFAPVVRQ